MMSEEQALNMLLMSWRATPAPDALCSRVLDSFRRQMSRRAEEEEEMKRCPMCYEEFAPQFRFCPVDGLPLVSAQQPDALNDFTEVDWEQSAGEYVPASVGAANENVVRASTPPKAATFASMPTQAAVRAEYQLTLLTEASLLARLTTEMRAVTAESRLTWPEFKREPRAFVQRTAAGYGLLLRRSLARENVAYGLVTALVVVLTLVVAVVALEGYHKAHPMLASNVNEDLVVTDWVTPIPPEQKQEAGPAGMAAHGTGGGSLQNKERPGGGGGGGRHEALPASHGILPPATWQPQLVAPDPKPPVILNAHLPTPATLQGDPVLFPPDARALPYGDPKSQATELSSGAGDGNGIGDGNGGGVGSGRDNGYGPGEGGNTGGGPMKPGGGGVGCCGGTIDYANTIFTVHNVTRRAVITAKPEPQFTEEARKNNVTGEVALRMILSASGQVTNIVPIKRLPDGLTEKAIEAARRIQFTPAEKDGHKVSQYVSVVYNFNIY
jgi:TonB family protein